MAIVFIHRVTGHELLTTDGILPSIGHSVFIGHEMYTVHNIIHQYSTAVPKILVYLQP